MAPSPDTIKIERYNSYLRRVNSVKIMAAASSKLLFRTTLLTTVVLVVLFTVNYPPLSSSSTPTQTSPFYNSHRSLLSSYTSTKNSGAAWEKQVRTSAAPRRHHGMSVLVTGAAGFVGTHCSLALKKRGDGVVGLDNFNSYYDPSLKRDRQAMLGRHGVMVVDGDINDGPLLVKLFDVAAFTHVLHLAAQAGVRYAMKNPQSYVASNIAGLVNLFEIAAKTANPQPAIVWASSSSVYGLNTESPFSELHRTDQPLSTLPPKRPAKKSPTHTTTSTASP
ncbi:uncharacterized protein A4U43_C09F10920 [Asparagus officinalis]|uniref:NAD(P)-binding domain-containing protein n=1 Tax=Asparagus officinalis TaxID=4686 RepID=A0A5P1E8J3_ASPOF|nr:uncharacterized protein A4U43_C09F10920 [Asparagus officinalis]